MTVQALTVAVPFRDTTDGYNFVVGTWAVMANGDSGTPYQNASYADRTVQVSGTFGAASDGLQNDAQRQIFARTIEPLKLQSLETMSSFEAQQRRTSVEQSANASIESSIDLAAANPTDSTILAQSKSDILKRIQATANVNGWTPDIADAARTAQLTKLHTQVIQNLIDTKPTQASAYLAANRGEIAGSQLDALDKAVRVGTVAQQSQTATADILSRNTTESSALAAARKDYTGQVQDAIVTRIHERFGEQQTMLERDQKQAADKAWQILTQGGGYSAIPASLLNRMSGEAVKGLQDEASRRANGAQVQTDWGTFQKLREQIFANPSKPFDITPYLAQLNESERKSLVDLSTSLASPQTKYDAVKSEKQINDAIAQLGFPKTLSSAQEATIGQLKSQADQAFMDFQRAHGRQPIDTERQAILDSLMQPGTIPGRIFGTTDARRFQGTTDRPFTVSPPKEGDRATSKSGKPMVYSAGRWQYVQ